MIDTVRNTIAQHYVCTTGNYLRRIVDGLHARGDECQRSNGSNRSEVLYHRNEDHNHYLHSCCLFLTYFLKVIVANDGIPQKY